MAVAGRPEGTSATSAVIFGGSGFIGAHLTARLLQAGVDVHVADVVRPPDQPGLTFHPVDVRAEIPGTLPHVDVAYNLAAVHRTPGHDEHEYYETNVAGAVNITAWCRRQAVGSLVFTSSISVYGPSEETKDEESQLAPNSPYGWSKMLAEAVHEEWLAQQTDRRLVVARPAVVFGRGENGNFTRLASALRRKRFAYPGRTDTVKACIYVRDLVESLLFTESLGRRRVLCNAAYPRQYTIGEICETFHDVAGFNSPRTVPPAAVRLALASLSVRPPADRSSSLHPERVRKLTASTRITPAVLVAEGFEWATDLSSALTEWQKDGFT